MKRIICWVVGHRWRECIFADWTLKLVGDLKRPLVRCLGACDRCGQHCGVIACIVCDRVAR